MTSSHDNLIDDTLAYRFIEVMLATRTSEGASPLPDFTAALDRLARQSLGGPVIDLKVLTGGASQELWSFDAGGRGLVLRRLPPAHRFENMATIPLEHEAAIIRAVEVAGVPVAPVVHVLAPNDGVGRGFIAHRMPGEALGRRVVDHPDFAGIRPHLAAACGKILAGIHGVDTRHLPELASVSPAASIDLLERQLRDFGEPRPVFEAALVWLRRHCPDTSPPALVHGDFRTGNFLLEPDGISAILDWEACHFGDPVEDLGWLSMPVWRFGRLDRPVGGFGQHADLLAAYASAGGRMVEPDRLRFWEVRGMLRWGLTCMAMAFAFASGNRSLERAAVGRRSSEAEIELLYAMTGEGGRA